MHCTNCGKENEEGFEFCMYCGAKLYKPESTPPEPETVMTAPPSIEEEPVPTPEKKPASPPKEKKSPKINRNTLLIVMAAAGSMLAILTCYWSFVGFWGFQIFSPAESLVYVIQENLQENATAIMTVKENGKNNKEIYSDNDGLRTIAGLLEIYPWLVRNFSPDGSTMAVGDENGDLLLLNRDSSVPVSVDLENKGGIAGYGILQGFSPNGNYFGFTDSDGSTTLILTIVDREGNEVYSAEDRVFGAFLSDNEQVVVYETDGQKVTGLGVLNFLSGDYNFLTSVEDENATYSNWYSFASPVLPSPNDSTIYYVDGKSLLSIPTRGGSASQVYESDEGISYAFFSPDERTIAINDGDGNNLYLYDTRRDEKLRIANDVENIKFSPNGKYLAYSTTESNSERDMYVTKSSGDDKVRIVKNANWLKFAFSPDNKYIAYIDGSSSDEGGSLYIARRDGSDATRLDTGVWSFRFADDGNSIIYVKVNDLDTGNPESEIYKIRINGRNKQRLLQADDGLFTFIWPVP